MQDKEMDRILVEASQKANTQPYESFLGGAEVLQSAQKKTIIVSWIVLVGFFFLLIVPFATFFVLIFPFVISPRASGASLVMGYLVIVANAVLFCLAITAFVKIFLKRAGKGDRRAMEK